MHWRNSLSVISKEAAHAHRHGRGTCPVFLLHRHSGVPLADIGSLLKTTPKFPVCQWGVKPSVSQSIWRQSDAMQEIYGLVNQGSWMASGEEVARLGTDDDNVGEADFSG
jgi:hypothetical protein